MSPSLAVGLWQPLSHGHGRGPGRTLSPGRTRWALMGTPGSPSLMAAISPANELLSREGWGWGEKEVQAGRPGGGEAREAVTRDPSFPEGRSFPDRCQRG